MLCVVLCIVLLRGLTWNLCSFGLSKYRMSDEHYEEAGFKNCFHRLYDVYANPPKSDSSRVHRHRYNRSGLSENPTSQKRPNFRPASLNTATCLNPNRSCNASVAAFGSV